MDSRLGQASFDGPLDLDLQDKTMATQHGGTVAGLRQAGGPGQTLLICRDCLGPAGSNPYWTGIHGQKINTPRCRDCHERAVLRSTREHLGDPAGIATLASLIQANWKPKRGIR